MNVKVIKANQYNFNAVRNSDEIKKYNVAAYARVSTEFDEQEDSFERQVNYYTSYIQNEPEWNFVKVYSDPGISGTRADKRPGFLQMIEDCKAGKIDKILCKSLARFARNTVDALNYIRLLKEMGVSIYFEAQNIDTGTPGGDVLLTILAAMAEEESRTISKNVKWAMEKKFQKGDFLLNYTRFLGYKRDENHNLVIVEEEAEIVRRIFREFIGGYSISQICNRLDKDGVQTPSGGKKWYYTVVESMLHNEKYYGSALMGKSYKPDVLSKKRYKNEGQVEQYYAEDTHPAIISKETWDIAQLELKRRTRTTKDYKSSPRYGIYGFTFSKMVRCGCCGAYYTRIKQRARTGEDIAYWWCGNRRKNERTCGQKGVKEELLQKGFVKVLNALTSNINDLKSILMESINEVFEINPSEKVNEINSKIEKLQEEMGTLYSQKSDGKITMVEYQKEGSKISGRIDALRKEKESIETTITSNNLSKQRLNEIIKAVELSKPTDEFDEEIFKRLVDVVIMKDRYNATFKFKIGIERTINLNDL